MNRYASFPLPFDRRFAPDIQRIAAVLGEGPPEGMTVLRIARTAANLGALALMVLAFLATLHYLGLAV